MEREDLVSKKKKKLNVTIKQKIKQHKNWLTLMMLQKKT